MAITRQHRRQQLRVNSYDRVSSWLVSLLIVACVTVGALVLIYFTQHYILEDVSMPITPVATGGGGTGGETGTQGGDLEPPGVEDAPPTTEPQLQETLSAVATAVSKRTAILSDEQIDFGAQPAPGTGSGDRRTPGFGGGRGGGAGGGIGSGFGPGRSTGPGEPRREIRFEPASIKEYAQWLDFFRIELGVLGQDNKVYYAYNLSREKPDVRVGEPTQEQRLYMNPSDSQFAALDRQLAVRAGIADKGRIILQFYPTEAQAILEGLEQNHAGTRTREEIRATVFRVTRKGTAFEFTVEDQSYR